MLRLGSANIMSDLIEQLIHTLERFNGLGEKAESKLSETGERDKQDGDLPMHLDFWHKVVDESQDATKKMKLLLPGFPTIKVK